MSNFFAQPDALAYGKTIAELEAEKVPAALHAHKEFPGNRPSLSLLFPTLNAYTSGQVRQTESK
jgi:glucose-6-phosphate isomerase